MSTRSSVRRTAPQFRRDAATHRFAIGQTVRLRNSFGKVPKNAEVYRITRTLPLEGDSLQYRIRNDDERHERVTTEDNLEAASLPLADDGATLIERTFGNG